MNKTPLQRYADKCVGESLEILEIAGVSDLVKKQVRKSIYAFRDNIKNEYEPEEGNR